MARWIPDYTAVDKNEMLGRRLFARPSLAGASGQKPIPSLDLCDFEEKRSNGAVSLDRVGKTGVDQKVLKYLTPRAHKAAAGFRSARAFNGWACIRAKFLMENGKLPMEIVPAPIPNGMAHLDENDLNSNVYHAEARPQKYCDPYFVALHLRHQFETRRKIEHPVGD